MLRNGKNIPKSRFMNGQLFSWVPGICQGRSSSLFGDHLVLIICCCLVTKSCLILAAPWTVPRQAVWKTAWRSLKKLKIKLLCNPSIPVLDIFPNEMKSISQRDIWTHIFTAVLFTTAKIWKQSKCPLTDKWIKKMQYIYIPNGIWFCHKK